ncbi:universal stress protein [Actinoplanes sp. NPDC048988]|uniref:universal stress protein n=1 Tax=Actinoplanes sp. NPDC048988 TaxID=3363901 RepID=UPI0037206704
MRIVVAAKPEADTPWVADAVIGLAKQTGATVAVVAADEVELERLAAVPRSVFADKAYQSASAMAARLAEAGIEASVTVVPGRPVPAVLEFADQQQADLIVAGSSSRPTVAERLLGSVPLDLIKRSSRPVLLVTHPQHQP